MFNLRETLTTYRVFALQIILDRYIEIYVAVIFLTSWIYWVPEALYNLGIIELGREPSRPFSVVAVWMPGLVTIGMFLIFSQREALRELFGRLTQWRVHWIWYAFALGLPIFMPLSSLWISKLIFDTAPQLKFQIDRLDTDLIMLQSVFTIFLYAIPNALFEEIGWRGFLQTKLDQYFPIVIAGSITGIIWGLWRIPTWITSDINMIELILLFMSIIKSGVLYAWLNKKVEQSLIPLVILHAATNVSGELIGHVPIVEPILWIVVIWLIVLEEHGKGALNHMADIAEGEHKPEDESSPKTDNLVADVIEVKKEIE